MNIEHVSSAELIEQEISRRTPAGLAAQRARERGQRVPDSVSFGVMRRWFWTRKPDAGFVLTDFPATLLQAKVFDEWLETRGMEITACACDAQSDPAIIDHYRTHGIDLVDAVQLLGF